MRSVVITGSSTGIGRACALTLDCKGFRVFAGVRKEADGDALREVASPLLTPVRIDVTDPASIEAMAEKVAAEVGETGLAGVVNNAGTTLPCPIEYLPVDGFRRQLEVNLVGPLAVTRTLLPLLCKGQGRVVNVTSAAGKAGVPLMAPYVAAKHGLEGLSDVMRLEFRQLGIQVAVIEPGFVSTAMRGKLVLDTEAAIRELPDEGRRRYGPQLVALAESISQHAAQGSDPAVPGQVRAPVGRGPDAMAGPDGPRRTASMTPKIAASGRRTHAPLSARPPVRWPTIRRGGGRRRGSFRSCQQSGPTHRGDPQNHHGHKGLLARIRALTHWLPPRYRWHRSNSIVRLCGMR